MSSSDWNRRRFLEAATSTLGIGATAGLALATATPERVVNRRLPAAAAGVLWIGGDLEVARMGFGAMRLTGEGIWGEPRDARECRAVLRRAVDLGVNFIDTADAYGPNVSERLIAEALHPYPRGLLIATKGGLVRKAPGNWRADGSPAYLRAACEGSLRRLKTSQIDLYQLHSVDKTLPYEDSIGELARLQQEGKIRHIGVSNVDVDLLNRARAIAKIAAVQNRYNAGDRSSEEVLRLCERERIAFLPWSPLGMTAPPVGETNPSQGILEQVAKERGWSMPQASLAWLLTRSKVMLPIPGTSRLAHVEENVRAAKLRFTRQEMQRIG